MGPCGAIQSFGAPGLSAQLMLTGSLPHLWEAAHWAVPLWALPGHFLLTCVRPVAREGDPRPNPARLPDRAPPPGRHKSLENAVLT